jgi:glycosyltransferase involved in cell wall biosynthesis
MLIYVLMSTYNGERYIEEQISSILDQLPPNGRLLVRDDGSTDRTPEKIATVGDTRIEMDRGENVGFARSFLSLLLRTPPQVDMVMFADQDDVWLPFKVGRAWEWLRPHANTPALYCSAQMLVDESLNPQQRTPPWPRPPSFTGAIAENIVTGCTAALNSRAVELLKQAGIPPQVRFHDWWLYLVVSALGTVLVDDEPTILYRQHGGNIIGRGAGWWGRHVQMVRFLLRTDWVGILLGQIAELRRCYDDQLSSGQRELLVRYFKIDSNGFAAPRRALILGHQRWRQTLRDEVLLRVLLLANCLRIFTRRKQ